MKSGLLIAVAIISSVELSSCSQRIVPEQRNIALPTLRLPRIPAAELQCLADGTYEALRLRDRLLKQRIETIKGVCGEFGVRFSEAGGDGGSG